MKIKRKVTVEIDRIKVTVQHRPEAPTWCGICRTKAEFLEPGDAARLVTALAAQGITVSEQDLHFFDPGDSRPLICLNSIISEQV